MVLGIGYTLRIRKRSSYLHKDSYLAQRKERTLGYEGRYRRTLSPSGLGSKSTEVSPPQRPMANATSTGKLETTLTPSAWEKYHNIRAPSTTVIFTSNEIAKSTASSQPVFHRSISWDSNLFNNKTGFSQASTPPPVAQVAPLRGTSEINRSSYPHASLEELDLLSGSGCSGNGGFEKSCASLSLKESDEDEVHMKNIGTGVGKKQTVDSQCQSTDLKSTETELPMSMTVLPLRYQSGFENKENIPISGGASLKKSEISLRVNCTSDASSQTDSSSSACSSGKEDEGDVDTDYRSPSETSRNKQSSPSHASNVENEETELKRNAQSNLLTTAIPSSYTGRQKSNEELECDELSRDLAKQLPQGDKLQSLLVPLPEHKTPADYMEGLFPLELKICVDCSDTKLQNQINLQLNSSPVPDEQDINNKNEKLETSGSGSSPTAQDGSRKESDDESIHKRCNGHAPLPADSAYFTTSESKAKFLTQYVKDMHNESISRTDSQELIKQKEELVSRISRKLEILRTEQLEIREEIQSNEHLGQLVIERVKQTAKRNEFDKFKLHVEEIEKITSLLLGLSGRLARAENALMGLAENSNPQEKKILESKRDKLKEQLDEAKILKENIDRRSAQVSGFLQKYLTVEEYADYHHFVKMKAKLIIDSREIDDKIKLGDEQMMALQETLSSSS
ncbi:unnamed protein product [Allacma fusca]|uniref:ASD2 domain-containing protein n=1 Tax=Allacma fusca TaxID=39272 RepID=A0A8J2JC17_9HEXA|nr:unnamed protein product [Allacma fusca]